MMRGRLKGMIKYKTRFEKAPYCSKSNNQRKEASKNNGILNG